MSDVNLLFLAPHWRVALVRMFQESWAQNRASGRLIGADSDPDSGALRNLPWSHPLPLFDDPDCLKALKEICKTESVHAIVPMTNKAVEFLDVHRNDFKKEKIRLYVQSAETVKLCHDKFELARHFEGSDVCVPRTYLVGEVAGDAKFPLLAKPRFGEGGKKVIRAETVEDLEFITRRYPGHVLQEYVDGPEYSIDWYSDAEGSPRVIVPRERLFVRGGEVMKSRIALKPELIKAVRVAGHQLGLIGPCTLQGIVDAQGRFWFTDINLRFGSGFVHTIAAGAEVPLMMHQELSGVSESDPSTEVKDGSLMVRYTDHQLW